MNNKLVDINVSWISGMPRSGTTWLSQVFASSPEVRLKSCPLFSYEFKNSLDEGSSTNDWQQLFYDLYQTNSEFLDQEHLRKTGLVPCFLEKDQKPRHLIVKSNRFHNLTPSLLKLNNDVRVVYVVRNPCATIYSWLSNPHEFPLGADPLVEWKLGSCRKTGVGEFWGFDDWVEVTTQALRLSENYPERHCVLSYETLVQEPLGQIKKLCRFLGVNYVEQMAEFIKTSHSRHDIHKHSVFKDPARIHEWQNNLDPLIISECKSLVAGTELEKFL